MIGETYADDRSRLCGLEISPPIFGVTDGRCVVGLIKMVFVTS